MSIKNKRKHFKLVEFKKGELYSCAYSLTIKDENNCVIGLLESYTPFVVLEVDTIEFLWSRTVHILSTDGVCGFIFADQRYVKNLNAKP
jgi:hypothetical protein